MKIGIDISQMAYEGTGVAKYMQQLVQHLLNVDTENEYILFFSSFRKPFPSASLHLPPNARIKAYRFPPSFLDFLWNRLHIVPIEWLIGEVDVFLSSDWTQPPSRAKKVTIVYDLIVYKHPEETAAKIIEVQKRKLQWVKKECAMILCISEATKKDAMEILGIEESTVQVIYPGI